MKRNSKYGFDVNQPEGYNRDERYNLALKQVKKLKGFYVHLTVYLIVNAFIIVANNKLSSNPGFWQWETFSTALFWGIGLAAHGLSVFGGNIFFGHNWEERKIKELMEKEETIKNSWK